MRQVVVVLFTWSCVVMWTEVVTLAIMEEQNLVPDDDDSLQDLTTRMKKSPEDPPSYTAPKPNSESDIKQVLTKDIKTKIGDLKELKTAYKQVVTDFFGSNNENSNDKLTASEKSVFDSEINYEKSEDIDSVRNPRQYYSGGYENVYLNRENEHPTPYSNENYEHSYSSQSTNDNIEDPYIASSYHPDPRTFGIGSFQGSFQAGFQGHADAKPDTTKLHSKPSYVQYVPFYYPVVLEYPQVVQPSFPAIKPPEISIKPVTIKPVAIKPLEIKPLRPIEIKPIEIKPLKPIEIKPLEIKPLKPIELRPIKINPLPHHKPVVRPQVVQPQIQYQPIHQEVKGPVYFQKIVKGVPGKFFSKQIIFGPSADFSNEHNYYPASYSYPSTYSNPPAETHTPAYYPQEYSYDTPSYAWYPQQDLQPYNSEQNTYPQEYYSQQLPGYSYYPQSNVNYPYGNIYRNSGSETSIQSYRDELGRFLTQLSEVSSSVENKTESKDQVKAEIEKEKNTIKFLEESSTTDYEEMLGYDGQGFNVKNIVDWLSGEMDDIHERWESLKNDFRKPNEDLEEEATQDMKNDDVSKQTKQ